MARLRDGLPGGKTGMPAVPGLRVGHGLSAGPAQAAGHGGPDPAGGQDYRPDDAAEAAKLMTRTFHEAVAFGLSSMYSTNTAGMPKTKVCAS